jgi:hypothetical protein
VERRGGDSLGDWIALSLLFAIRTLLEWLVAKLLNYFKTSTLGTFIFINWHTTLTIQEKAIVIIPLARANVAYPAGISRLRVRKGADLPN